MVAAWSERGGKGHRPSPHAEPIGNGASYGAGAVSPSAPPLADGLYDCLRMAFPESWGTIDGKEDELFRQHFELGVDRLWGGATRPAAAPRWPPRACSRTRFAVTGPRAVGKAAGYGSRRPWFPM